VDGRALRREPAGAKSGCRFCRYAYREPAACPISMVLIVGKLALHARQRSSSNFPESADTGAGFLGEHGARRRWRLRPDRCQFINVKALAGRRRQAPKRGPAEQAQIASMGWSVCVQPMARARVSSPAILSSSPPRSGSRRRLLVTVAASRSGLRFGQGATGPHVGAPGPLPTQTCCHTGWGARRGIGFA